MRQLAAGLFIASVFFSGIATGQPALPDLVIWGPVLKPFTQTREFTGSSCEVVEGCIGQGTRRLLRFHIETRNQGTADLVLGNPAENPLFEYAACHGHYHFNSFIEARLLDSNSVPVAAGSKIGFCLEDVRPWDTNANAFARYDCQDQGIQRGWADVYVAGLSCQYIDITGVQAGNYIFEIEVDPENWLPELDESNNVVRVPLTVGAPCTVPPANDAFTNATTIAAGTTLVTGNSECATSEANEPDLAGNTGGRSVWYRWTAPFTGRAYISTDGSTFDTLLGVFTGNSLNALTLLGENDDGGFNRCSLVVLNVSSGTSYRIMIDGYNAVSGDYHLNIIPDTNDAFANCAAISGVAGTIRGYNFNARSESGEPRHANERGGHSVWYCWTAPFTGPVRFDTTDSLFDTLLAAYTGNTLGSLVPIASNNNEPPLLTSGVTFNAVSNTTYRIAIDGYDGSVGTFLLHWRPVLRLVPLGLEGGTFQFQIVGAPGDHCVIETSGNLRDWGVWQEVTITNSTGSMVVSDNATLAGQNFYRVRRE